MASVILFRRAGKARAPRRFSLVTAIRRLAREQRTRRELHCLSARLLRDVGVEPVAADRFGLGTDCLRLQMRTGLC